MIKLNMPYKVEVAGERPRVAPSLARAMAWVKDEKRPWTVSMEFQGAAPLVIGSSEDRRAA